MDLKKNMVFYCSDFVTVVEIFTLCLFSPRRALGSRNAKSLQTSVTMNIGFYPLLSLQIPILEKVEYSGGETRRPLQHRLSGPRIVIDWLGITGISLNCCALSRMFVPNIREDRVLNSSSHLG